MCHAAQGCSCCDAPTVEAAFDSSVYVVLALATLHTLQPSRSGSLTACAAWLLEPEADMLRINELADAGVVTRRPPGSTQVQG